MDTLSIMIRRIKDHNSPFQAGRDHIHHRLLDVGFSSMKVLGVLVATAALLAGIGIIAEIKEVPESFMFYGILILFGLHYAVTEKLNQKKKTDHP